MPGSLLLAVSVFGWASLIMRLGGHDWLGQAVALCSSGQLVWTKPAPQPGALAATLIDWLAMILAMAPLMLRHELGWLWRAYLPRRRWLAWVGFTCGYGVPWALLVMVWSRLGDSWLDGDAIVALVFSVVAWHCSPLRQRCLKACHAAPVLRAFGPAALVDAGRYGLRSGVYCSALCGPAMVLAMSLPANHLMWMAVLTPILFIERYFPARPSGWGLPFAGARAAPAWAGLTPPPPMSSHISHS